MTGHTGSSGDFMTGRFSTVTSVAASALLPAALAGPAAAAPAASSPASGSDSSWRHAALIYHSASRTQQQWEQHLMAVNPAGQFTGQWLVEAVILTHTTV